MRGYLDARSRGVTPRQLSYALYLASPHWQALKRRWRRANPNTAHCACCQDTRYELHHVTYDRLGHEDLGDLMPLCKACHTRLHGKLKWSRQGERERRAQRKRLLKTTRERHPVPPLDRTKLLPPQG